jgi:hypothetical protein
MKNTVVFDVAEPNAVPGDRDYLVTCCLGHGGGSWARDKDLERAVKRCRQIVYADWRNLYKLDGEEVLLNLYDVTGQDSIEIGHGFIKGDNTDAPIQRLGTRLVRMPKSRGRR